MRVFVTGATGFIGLHLCKRLIEKDIEVFALVRNKNKAQLLPKETKIIYGDLHSFKDNTFIIPECDVVIHLAALISGNSDQEYIDINYHSVVDFINCLSKQKWKPKHFVFASSIAAGGASTRDRKLTEVMPDNPIDAYGVSKLKAENYLRNLDIPTTSFRPGLVIGPGDTGTLAVFKLAKAGIGFKPSGKAQVISIVYIDDLVDAIELMIYRHENKKELHSKYYVVNQTTLSVTEWFQEIGKGFNKKIIIISCPKILLKIISLIITACAKIIPFKNTLDKKQYKQITAEAFIGSSEKLSTELGWTAKVDFPESISKAINGYKTLGWL
jgi:nucleoside-diphosphate-sugar epimerase